MSHIPSQGPYVDTIILDCSRQTSEEVKGDPLNDVNALFTNKLGNGIKINPGDTISVSSAYVSERGCGGQVIEFKGAKQEGQTYTLNETVITKSQLPNKFPTTGATPGFQNLDAPRNLNHPAPLADFGPMGAKQVVHSKVPKTFTLSDNEVNMEISYYKSSNGEGYFHLPRRYDIKPPKGDPQVVGTLPRVMKHRQPNINNPDMLGQETQKGYKDAYDYDCPYNGRACVSPRITKLCPADWYIYAGLDDMGIFTQNPLETDVNDGVPGTPKYMLRSTCPVTVPRAGGLWDVDTGSNQKIYKQVGHDGHALQSFQMKQKNDNSRYTIYAKELCYYSEYVGDKPGIFNAAPALTSASAPTPIYEVPNSLDPGVPGAGEDYYGSPYLSRDDFLGTVNDGGIQKYTVCYDKEPACSGYTRYTEIKNLKVPKGFNSPSNVAETLTNQLNQTKEQRTIHGVAGSYLGPYKENIINQAGIDGADVGANYTQGGYDPRYYNQDSAIDGFYTDDTGTDEALYRSTYGSTLATGQRQILVSTILESETMKSFACGNPDTWHENNFIGYRGQNPRDVGADAPADRQIEAIDATYYPIDWKFTPERGQVDTITGPGLDNMVPSTWENETPGVAADKIVEVKAPIVKNIQYLSNYQYIGVKRPELFDAYREFQKPLFATGNASWRNFDNLQCLTGIQHSEFDTHPFITNCEWTDANLLRFKAVFDAQAKYPEIFKEYQYTNVEHTESAYNRITYPAVAKGVSPDYMRFIHINSWSGTTPIQKGAWRPDVATPISDNEVEDFPVYNHNSARMPLGNDNSNTPLTDPHATDSATGLSTWATTKMRITGTTPQMVNPLNQSRNAQDLSSSPLFVWYNEADKDNTINDGNQDKNLAYGCMFKYTVKNPAIGVTTIPGLAIHMDPFLCQEIWDNYTDNGGPIEFIGFNTHKIGGIPGHLSDPWADYQTLPNVLAIAMVVGLRYRIQTVGTTNWTLTGASANTVGIEFTCKLAGIGDGTCHEITPGIPKPNNWLNTGPLPALSPYGKGMGCGFDIHFNAYGTSCIALYSGYLDGDKYAVEKLQQGTEIPGVGTAHEVIGEFYMDRGCNDPADYHTNRPRNAEIEIHTATTRSTEIVFKNGGGGAPVFVAPVKGDIMEGTGVQTPCFVTAVDALTFTVSVTPPQTLAANTEMLFFEPLGPHSNINQNISKFIRERYVGANQPLLNFDDKGERFNFQQLHTPLYIGNEANAGDGLTSVALEEGKQVLEINRRLMGNDFSPEMMPYKTAIGRTKDPTTADLPPIQPMNSNLIPWQVYDSDGGIFLENFGLSEQQWKLSLWGVLGFTYGQFHPTGSGNRQARINNIIETTNLLVPTTNANLEASDVVKFRGNRYGSSLYTFQPPIASTLGPVGVAQQQKEVDYPVIVIDQTSAQINAEQLPRKMLKPFFLIKSNIIGDMSYYGGSDSGQNLPVVCVVNKENGFGDFYFQRGFDMEFTATNPRMITSITTSIHDPDMELANCGPDSSIIFKITKQNHANLDVVQDVLQQQQQAMMKHKDKLKFMAEEQLRMEARSASQDPVATPIGLGEGDIMDPNPPEDVGELIAQENAGGLAAPPPPIAPLVTHGPEPNLEPEPMPDSPIDVGTNDPDEKDMSRKRLREPGDTGGRIFSLAYQQQLNEERSERAMNLGRMELGSPGARQMAQQQQLNRLVRARTAGLEQAAGAYQMGINRPRTPERRPTFAAGSAQPIGTTDVDRRAKQAKERKAEQQRQRRAAETPEQRAAIRERAEARAAAREAARKKEGAEKQAGPR